MDAFRGTGESGLASRSETRRQAEKAKLENVREVGGAKEGQRVPLPRCCGARVPPGSAKAAKTLFFAERDLPSLLNGNLGWTVCCAERKWRTFVRLGPRLVPAGLTQAASSVYGGAYLAGRAVL
ncbi:hypothetical protein MTO96_002102 [Rhipicephalus appendiculatus]